MKTVILCLLAVFPLVGMCQDGDYIILGKLANAKAPTKIYLVNGEDLVAIDSTIVQNGVFSFKGKITNSIAAFLTANQSKPGQGVDSRFLYLEEGTIQVTSADESLRASAVRGTATNDDVVLFKKVIEMGSRPYQLEIDKKRKGATPDQQNSTSFNDELLLLENSKIEAIKVVFKDFVQAHPNSFVSLNALVDLADVDDYASVNGLFERLSSPIRNSPAGQRFAERLTVLKRVSIGAVLPDIALEDTSGTLIQLSSLKGKYVLVDVWASWCAPCRKENPNLLKAYTTYKDRNFKIVSISLDTEKGKWRNAIQKDGLTWVQLIDTEAWEGQVVTTFGLNSLPQNYLLDSNGVIIAKNLIGLDLHTKLAELFGSAAN